ncbi:MAG: hypothetical protein AAGC78_06950 [Cellvibrio sp.]|uniref:hypothetical protein n=1 Tax=Cellvibrio sp. TaxID=1965322 RepID=UPI0031AD5573
MKVAILNLIKSKTLYLLIITLGLIAYSLQSIQPSFSDFMLTTPSGKTQAVASPGFMQSYESGVYRLAGTIEMNQSSSSILRIIPDDEILSLTVNQKNVDLNRIPHEQRKDYNKGFIYDLSDYLHEGKNQIEILYSDQGGMMGIVISAEGDASFAKLTYLLLTILAILIALKLVNKLKFSIPIKVLFIGALVIRLVYFMVTPGDVRDHDLGDHIGYSEYLTQHWMPPPVDYAIGGAFFHPPLYYYTGAIVYKATQLIEPNNKVAIYRVQQLLSLVYSMGFVLFGLMILNELLNLYRKPKLEAEPITPAHVQEVQEKPGFIRRLCKSLKEDSLLWIIGALFAFWPSAIIHSVRIGNDPLLYFLFTASLYYIVLWYRHDQKRDLMIASIVGAAAILTKANGEILVAVLGVIGLYKMISTKQWATYFKMAIVPCVVMLLAVAITVGPGLMLKMQGKRDKLYIDNIDGLSQANLVGNTATNYFWFDVKIFITEPFTDPYDDRMGRQFFWNYLGKTGLFGEFKYPSLMSINTAVSTSFLAVLMFIYMICGLYYMAREDFKRMTPILLSGFFLWAGVTYMRMTFPANIDFRYIVPILVTFCGLYAVSILSFERIGATRMANIGKTLSVLFSISSVLFILGIV